MEASNGEKEAILKLLPEERLEIYPCAMSLEEFTVTELEGAVKEYLSIHNFSWSRSSYPKAKGIAQNLDCIHKNYPQDMSDAMSLSAFSSWLENKPLTEESARTFCQTVCSVAKGMYYLYRYSRGKFASIEETFESAISLQYALYPQLEKLKQN